MRGSKGLSLQLLQHTWFTSGWWGWSRPAPPEISGHLNFLGAFMASSAWREAAWIYWLDDIIQQLIVKEEGGFLWHRHQLLESLLATCERGAALARRTADDDSFMTRQLDRREEAGKNATPFMALWYAWHPVNTETFMALILVANDKDYFACNNYMLWKISKLFFIDGVVALTF